MKRTNKQRESVFTNTCIKKNKNFIMTFLDFNKGLSSRHYTKNGFNR